MDAFGCINVALTEPQSHAASHSVGIATQGRVEEITAVGGCTVHKLVRQVGGVQAPLHRNRDG